MSTVIRMKRLYPVAIALLLVAQLGAAGVASAAGDDYDPRRDPNYSRATSEATSLNWPAIWSLVHEFETRAYAGVDRMPVVAPYAQPQPWHYVQEIPSPVATSQIAGEAVYGGMYGGPFYGYGPWFPGWWATSPRIPWQSLVPVRSHSGHGRRHEGP